MIVSLCALLLSCLLIAPASAMVDDQPPVQQVYHQQRDAHAKEHDKLIARRIEYVKKSVPLTTVEEQKLNEALIAYDHSRFDVWRESMKLRKEAEAKKEITDEEAKRYLQQLVELDDKMEQTHTVFYAQLSKIGFDPVRKLKIYLSLKSFHSKMTRNIREK